MSRSLSLIMSNSFGSAYPLLFSFVYSDDSKSMHVKNIKNIYSLRSLVKLFLSYVLIISILEAREVSIESIPKAAEIYVINKNKKLLLGKTPLKVDWGILETKAADSESFQVKIEKDGYISENVYISNLGKNNIFISAQLKLDFNAKYVNKIDNYVESLFRAQRLVRTKDYGGAITVLEQLEQKYKHFSIIYELKGGAYYLQKDFRKALSNYRQAFELNPKNLEAFKMKKYLEEIYKEK